MKKMKVSCFGMGIPLLGLLFVYFTACNQTQDSMKPPLANKIKKELSIHGDVRIDNYYWMNKREDPAVLDYLKKENAYTEAMLKHTEGLQDKLYEEIVGRIKQTDMSVPFLLNGYYYYTRYEEGQEYPLYCRKKGSLEEEEEIMLDGNAMARGHDYFSISGLSVSPDNQLLAFGVDTVSRRKYTLHIKDLGSGKELGEAIPNTTGYAAWANDNKTLFYTQKNDVTLRPEKIFIHKLGDAHENDQLVYFEEDEEFTTSAFQSKSRELIMIGCYSTLSTEYRFIRADKPDEEFRFIQPRQNKIEYYVEHYKDKFYIRTNFDAKNFRLMEAPVQDPGMKSWKEVIPHRPEVLLEDFEVFKNFLAVDERIKGLTNLRIIDWKNNTDYNLDFGESTYMAYFSRNVEFDTELLRYGYTSLTTPNSVYDFNMITKEKELLKQQEVVGGYDPAGYQAERLYVKAQDGTEVPMSLVYKKGIQKDRTNPLLIYGYGSYGSSMDPYFSSVRLSLLDRGFIFAIAHVRGGEELGRQWYEDGKLLNKKNTFTDFIACTEYLIENGYTNPELCFAMGGSAGGLLMGAVVNMRPDLYKGIVAAVPFVDVITTMLDENIPLTTGEYDEWGDPRQKEYYDYILSYSPYDNVTAKDYPAMLVTTGWHDSQVQYWEPAKWVAKLRDLKTDDNLLVLWTNLDYGHSGASGRFKRYKETALEYAFILDQAGINE
jgi:oligopeptidase B